MGHLLLAGAWQLFRLRERLREGGPAGRGRAALRSAMLAAGRRAKSLPRLAKEGTGMGARGPCQEGIRGAGVSHMQR